MRTIAKTYAKTLTALIAIASLALFAAYFISRSAALHDWVISIVVWARTHGAVGSSALFMAQVLVCITGVLPASPLVVAAGGLYGLWGGVVLAFSATFVGGVCAFLTGRYLFRSPLKAYIAKQVSLQRLDEAISAQTWRAVVVLRLSPVLPYGLMSYALSLTGLRLRDFALGSFGGLPAVFAYVYSGAIASALLLGPSAGIVRGIFLLVGFVATLIAGVFLTRRAQTILNKTETD